jgi:hypothetical protein
MAHSSGMIEVAMTPDELFEAALQLAGTSWKVVRSDFSGKPPMLEIVLEFARGSQFQCPQCGQLCGVHDPPRSVGVI